MMCRHTNYEHIKILTAKIKRSYMGILKEHSKREGKGRRKSINLAIVSSNNHYAGFGPGTANIFRKMVGLPEATWNKEQEEEQKSHLLGDVDHSKQSTLSDFIT